MSIEERDLPLLIALQENPLAPASSIAKALGVSTPTVISRLQLLQEKHSYYSVIADLIPETLGLEIVDLFIEINNIKNTEFFENVICYNHPFTLFRIRCFGALNGLYVQFRLPLNSKNLLMELLEDLKKKGHIQNYFNPEVLKNVQTIYTKVNLSNWEPQLMRWSFDWEKWYQDFENVSFNFILSKTIQSQLDRLDELDIALLQEFTMNARRKNTELMDSLNLDKNDVGIPQKVSRKIDFLNQNIVAQNRVFLRWETFEIYNSFLIECQCDEKISAKLQNLLVKEPIPFESTYKILSNGFLWYIRCPASHFSNISDFIWKVGTMSKFYYLDYKKSEYYGLWKNAFEPLKHSWSINLMKKEKIIK